MTFVAALSTLHDGPVHGRLFVAGVTGNTAAAVAVVVAARLGVGGCFLSKASLHLLLDLYLKCAE